MTTTWDIIELTCKQSENGLSNIVYKIKWECKVSDTLNNTMSLESVTVLGPPTPSTFTAYNNLTKQQVMTWLHSTLGQTRVAEIEARQIERLNEKVQTIVLDLPF